MPVSAPKIFPKQAYTLDAGLPQMVQDLCRFLNDDTGFSTPGPGWVLEFADDGTANSSAPTSGGLVEFSELPPANLWVAANTPTVGSWVLMRSLPGNNANTFQVVIKVATGALRFTLIPNGDATIPTNGTTTAGVDPVLPATALGYFDGTADSGLAASWLSVAADEGMVTWHIDNQAGAGGSWGYLGETDEGPGTRNYVLGSLTNGNVYVFSAASANPFRTLSLRDGVTVVGAASRWVRFGNGGSAFGLLSPLDALGIVPMFRLGVECWLSGTTPTGHVYFAGWLRNIREAQMNLAQRGTIGLNWMSISQNPSQAGIAIAWDGATTYP